ARLLLDAAREHNFKGIVTLTGDAVLTLARDYLPSAILLSLQLSGTDSFTILERLKRDPATRHIPVHVLSSTAATEFALQEEERQKAISLGAKSYLPEPSSNERLQAEFLRIEGYLHREKRNLLVVEDDDLQRNNIVELIGSSDVNIVAVRTGVEALESLAAYHFDCVVLDLTLPDMSGFDVLDTMANTDAMRDVPVIVYTAKELDRDEITKLKRIGKTVVVKDARSPERLLN